MRPKIDVVADRVINVSIHASVKDATISMWDILDNFTVSIHASVKDATSAPSSSSSGKGVSIHASVKDATPCLWKALLITLLTYNFANDKVEKW